MDQDSAGLPWAVELSPLGAEDLGLWRRIQGTGFQLYLACTDILKKTKPQALNSGRHGAYILEASTLHVLANQGGALGRDACPYEGRNVWVPQFRPYAKLLENVAVCYAPHCIFCAVVGVEGLRTQAGGSSCEEHIRTM